MVWVIPLSAAALSRRRLFPGLMSYGIRSLIGVSPGFREIVHLVLYLRN
jgi:hypothetical protein